MLLRDLDFFTLNEEFYEDLDVFVFLSLFNKYERFYTFSNRLLVI